MENQGLEKSYADVNLFIHKVKIINKLYKSHSFLTKIFCTGILKDHITQSWDITTIRIKLWQIKLRNHLSNK